MSTRLAAVLGRADPVALAVRLSTAGVGLLSLMVAMSPGAWDSRLAAAFLLGLAVAPAVAPGGPWAFMVMLVAAGGWLARTEWHGMPAGISRLLVLAGLLYLLHALAALGAAVPYDAVVAPQVLVHWLRRVLAVLALALPVTAAVLAILRIAGGPPVHVAATVAGLALAVAGSSVLARRLRMAR